MATKVKPSRLGSVVLYFCVSKDGGFLEIEHRFLCVEDADQWMKSLLRSKAMKPFAGGHVFKDILLSPPDEIASYAHMRADVRHEARAWKRDTTPPAGLFD